MSGVVVAVVLVVVNRFDKVSRDDDDDGDGDDDSYGGGNLIKSE